MHLIPFKYSEFECECQDSISQAIWIVHLDNNFKWCQRESISMLLVQNFKYFKTIGEQCILKSRKQGSPSCDSLINYLLSLPILKKRAYFQSHHFSLSLTSKLYGMDISQLNFIPLLCGLLDFPLLLRKRSIRRLHHIVIRDLEQ